MAWWLVKSEPSAYSYARLAKEKKTVWDGVTNPVALRNIRAIKKGDRVIVYHTGDEKAAVGVAQAASDGYPDPRDPKLAVFDLVPHAPLEQPVALATIKASTLFTASPLVRQGRLSVVPLDEAQAEWILATGRGKG